MRICSAANSFSFWIYLDAAGTVGAVQVSESPLLSIDKYAIYYAYRNRPVYEHPEFAKMVNAQR